MDFKVQGCASAGSRDSFCVKTCLYTTRIENTCLINLIQATEVELRAGGIQDCIDAMRDFAPSIADKDRLSNVIDHLNNIRATLDGSAAATEAQIATRQIRHSLLLTYMKSAYISQDVISRILETVLPGGESRAHVLSGYNAAMNNQFKVDLAYLLVTRDLGFQRCMVKFAWTDSSPQGRFDYLLWKYRQIPAKHIVHAVELLYFLVTSNGGVLGDDIDADTPMAVTEKRRKCNQELATLVTEYLCVPTSNKDR